MTRRSERRSRLQAWLIIWACRLGVESYADVRHLTTDPGCLLFRAPRAGSELDRVSRGVSCIPCRTSRAQRVEA